MKRRTAFTLVELLVVIGVIALLISILLPALNKARQHANLVKCSAQLRDFGTAILEYSVVNKGYYPGPCLGQIRAGYAIIPPGSKAAPIGDYIWPYLKLPAPPQSGERIVMRNLICPAYQQQNDGAVDSGVAIQQQDYWAYQTWELDWAIVGGHRIGGVWFGYSSGTSFPNRAAELKLNTADPVPPMRISQVFKSSETGILMDIDKSLVMFNENYVYPSNAIASVPVHGGKPEKSKGLQSATGGDWNGSSADFKVFNPVTLGSSISKAATNPPRNCLFADGHVATIYKSGPPPTPYK
jgi:prepilin-type N-terminal cleavage/methylation domain-containing protein/prepilin-type processing-associated H-X9-DG protein